MWPKIVSRRRCLLIRGPDNGGFTVAVYFSDSMFGNVDFRKVRISVQPVFSTFV